MPHHHPHSHEHGHHHHPTDEQTSKRIGLLALFNLGIGSATLYLGNKFGNPLITMQGVHDTLDGGLHGMKYIASKQKDTLKKRFWRKSAAVALGATAIGIGAHEMYEAIAEPTDTTTTEVTVAWGALGANVVGAGIILGVRSNPNSRDALRHTVEYDLPASVATVIGTTYQMSGDLGVLTPGITPTVILAQLALGAHTVRETWQDIHHTH